MDDARIERIEWARLSGRRPRKAGCNARLGEHGQDIGVPIARVTTADGAAGFGWSRITREQAEGLVGFRLSEAFDPATGVREPFHCLELPLWDLAGRLAGKPVHALIARRQDLAAPFRVPCYDTSLYMDDLHLADDSEAAQLIAGVALTGFERGHRTFKIKVGRGAMHMDLEAGTRRDILVVRAVREAVGPDAKILLDANNGYNLNLTKRVLGETASAGVYWMEEPFHEDPRLYTNLKEWMTSAGIRTFIADGEGDASRNLLEWVKRGLIDVVQYDIFGHGLTRWLETGRQLDEWNARSAPHHYGSHIGNYASCHLASAVRGFEFAEWDEAETPGFDTSRYSLRDGLVTIPAAPGFGLELEESVFARMVKETGFTVGTG